MHGAENQQTHVLTWSLTSNNPPPLRRTSEVRLNSDNPQLLTRYKVRWRHRPCARSSQLQKTRRVLTSAAGAPHSPRGDWPRSAAPRCPPAGRPLPGPAAGRCWCPRSPPAAASRPRPAWAAGAPRRSAGTAPPRTRQPQGPSFRSRAPHPARKAANRLRVGSGAGREGGPACLAENREVTEGKAGFMGRSLGGGGARDWRASGSGRSWARD